MVPSSRPSYSTSRSTSPCSPRLIFFLTALISLAKSLSWRSTSTMCTMSTSPRSKWLEASRNAGGGRAENCARGDRGGGRTAAFSPSSSSSLRAERVVVGAFSPEAAEPVTVPRASNVVSPSLDVVNFVLFRWRRLDAAVVFGGAWATVCATRGRTDHCKCDAAARGLSPASSARGCFRSSRFSMDLSSEGKGQS